MTENEFLLQDRLTKIRSIIEKYGEENFFISFSGGKDSAVLSALVDMAVPENKIPRVFANTGIEYNMIVDFVKEIKEERHSWDMIMLKPKTPIRKMLETEGYPFKSKMHSQYLRKFQKGGLSYKSVRAYIGLELTLKDKPMFRGCPKKLKYQFTEENTLKISDMCCFRLKEEPLKEWSANNNKGISIIGIMKEEGGRRFNAQCVVIRGGKTTAFQPLVPITKEWEEWFIKEYNVKICDIYKPPFNFDRTGCKGCPFALHLQRDLEILEKFFPEERKQCEIIWKPVYDEYRRINYRLKKEK